MLAWVVFVLTRYYFHGPKKNQLLIQSIQNIKLSPVCLNLKFILSEVINILSFIYLKSFIYLVADKLHAGVAMEMCLLVAKGITDFPMAGMRLTGTMDVYWIVQDGGLCVLVSYLLGQSKVCLIN